MKDAFRPSGPALPCPVCGRTKDGDCRILSDGRVFCHSERQGVKGKKCESNDFYVFLGESNEAQGAGMWKLDETAPAKAHRAETHRAKAPREYGIRYFDYFFWDGTAVPAKRYRKDVEGQPKEIKWTRGGLGGRSQNEVAPYLWEKTSGAKQLFVVRGELKAELLAGRGFTAISCLNQKDELLAAELKAMRANGIEIVLVPDCDRADLDKWFKYLSKEVPGVQQLLAPGLPWSNPPADGGLGIEDWIYAKSPSNDQILAAITDPAIENSSNEQNLNTLEGKIRSIVDKYDDPLKQSALVKKEASELGFSLAAAEVNSFIRRAGYKEPSLYGEDINMPAESEAELWGNLILYQSSNLVVASPKVGKTTLIAHLMGCIIRRESHCLDQPLHNHCDHFIILGSDMVSKQWKKLIVKEGLGKVLPDGSINMPKIKLATKGVKLDLSPEGIKYIVELCAARINAMLVIDCLRSYLNGDENTREFIVPIERLMVALAEANCKTTVICVHHARKSGGATAIEAASGHSSITAAFDQTLKMSWLTAESELQRDKRILVSSSGRGEDQSIVVEHVGSAPARWISHGNAEELMRAEAVIATEEALTSQQANIYDHVQTLYENTGKGTSSRVIREQFQLTHQAANRRLNFLCRRGLLIKVAGQFEGDPARGGRISAVYVPHTAERIEERSSLPCADLGGGAALAAIPTLLNLPDLDSSALELPGALPPRVLHPPSISPAKTDKPANLPPFAENKEVAPGRNKNEESCPPLKTGFSTGLSELPNPLTSDVLPGRRVAPVGFTLPDPLVSDVLPGAPPCSLSNSFSSSFVLEENPMPFMAGLISNACGLHANDSANAPESLKPELGQAVQVFRKGEWESGWTICDSRNPHSLRIRIERDGKVFQLANQRWEIDLRPEPLEVPVSASKAGVGATELDTSSKAFKTPSNAMQMPPTAAEEDSFF